MKILFIILAFLILSNCASQTPAGKIENDAARPKPTVNNVNNVNVNNWKPIQNEANKIDENKQKGLDAQNEKLRQVPDEFIKIDFKNFKYPYARLKNGEYIEERKNRSGGITYSFDDVFFVNLNDDKKKEAVVMLYAASCGGSCDGGKSIVHFYSSEKTKPLCTGSAEIFSRLKV